MKNFMDNMKLTAIIFLSVFVGLLFSSCNDDEESNKNQQSGSSSSHIAYSSDGITWTAVKNDPFSGSVYKIAWGNDKFVTVGTKVGNADDGYSRHNELAYSNDGINWTKVNDNILDGDSWIADIAYSSDGINWTEAVDTGFSAMVVRSVVWGGDKFIVEGSGWYGSAYSADGTTWTRGKLPSSNQLIGWGGGIWIATGVSTQIINYSTDGGETWTYKYPNGIGGGIYHWSGSSTAWGNDRFIITGNDPNPYARVKGNIVYSFNGIDWTSISARNIPFEGNINTVAYGNGKFIISGSDGKMAYSPDGENWTAAKNNPFDANQENIISIINDIAWGKDKFVAVRTVLDFTRE